MNWLEISLSVDGELAEAVADVLNRHIYQGVATELEIDDENQQARSGQVIVRGYIAIDGHEAELRGRIENDLWHLRYIQPFPEPTYKLVQQQDWTEQWRQHYHPMPIGDRLLLVPAWYEPPESGRLSLLLEPGMAFGTGTHPTTRLAIEALEAHLKAGGRVYDIGCGSGILSIASVLLGAREVLALDIDSAAIQSTKENAELNKMLDSISMFAGSLDDFFSNENRDRTPGQLVIANILAKVLIEMLNSGLTSLLLPDAALVLSGILVDQVDEVMEAALANDLRLLELRGEKDWRAMVFKKKELPPRRGSSVLNDDSGG